MLIELLTFDINFINSTYIPPLVRTVIAVGAVVKICFFNFESCTEMERENRIKNV